MSLTQLPTELVDSIFEYLNGDSLRSIRLVSRELCDIASVRLFQDAHLWNSDTALIHSVSRSCYRDLVKGLSLIGPRISTLVPGSEYTRALRTALMSLTHLGTFRIVNAHNPVRRNRFKYMLLTLNVLFMALPRTVARIEFHFVDQEDLRLMLEMQRHRRDKFQKLFQGKSIELWFRHPWPHIADGEEDLVHIQDADLALFFLTMPQAESFSLGRACLRASRPCKPLFSCLKRLELCKVAVDTEALLSLLEGAKDTLTCGVLDEVWLIRGHWSAVFRLLQTFALLNKLFLGQLGYFTVDFPHDIGPWGPSWCRRDYLSRKQLCDCEDSVFEVHPRWDDYYALDDLYGAIFLRGGPSKPDWIGRFVPAIDLRDPSGIGRLRDSDRRWEHQLAHPDEDEDEDEGEGEGEATVWVQH